MTLSPPFFNDCANCSCSCSGSVPGGTLTPVPVVEWVWERKERKERRETNELACWLYSLFSPLPLLPVSLPLHCARSPSHVMFFHVLSLLRPHTSHIPGWLWIRWGPACGTLPNWPILPVLILAKPEPKNRTWSVSKKNSIKSRIYCCQCFLLHIIFFCSNYENDTNKLLLLPLSLHDWFTVFFLVASTYLSRPFPLLLPPFCLSFPHVRVHEVLVGE